MCDIDTYSISDDFVFALPSEFRDYASRYPSLSISASSSLQDCSIYGCSLSLLWCSMGTLYAFVSESDVRIWASGLAISIVGLVFALLAGPEFFSVTAVFLRNKRTVWVEDSRYLNNGYQSEVDLPIAYYIVADNRWVMYGEEGRVACFIGNNALSPLFCSALFIWLLLMLAVIWILVVL